MLRLLLPLAWREWRHHAWRHAVVMLAVALGVALAWSVHVINQSALAEFSAAVRSANGEPDLSLRGQREGFDDQLFERVSADAAVEVASPVLEVDTYARREAGERIGLRVLGVDGLVVAALAPDLLPRSTEAPSSFTLFDPQALFLNAAAREKLGLRDGEHIAVQSGLRWLSLRVAGSVAAGGGPLAVIDIAAAQAHFELPGKLTRIDLRLAPGSDRHALIERWQLPAEVAALAADESAQRASNLSRAYRVNLTVLALVALFVGAFLVFSVVSLSVAQRTPALALLGVLGLTASERRSLVLLETGLLGAAGSAIGLLLGSALALAAMRWLAGDLGGGYFPGVTPTLNLSPAAALLFFALGVASALAGAWVPARHAERLAPAVALKGLGADDGRPARIAWPLLVLLGGTGLALAPPIAGLPLAAYASVAALLFGGVALVPGVVQLLLARRASPRAVLVLMALRRAFHQRHAATAAVAGVVASLALSVALTVMVASFRHGVAEWLDQVLPADLYARTANSSAAAEQAWLDAATVQRAAALPGVQRVQASRSRALQLSPSLPAVALVTRTLDDPAAALPLTAPALPPRPGEVGVYVSEAMVALYGAKPGGTLSLPLAGRRHEARVLGVWRDFARQFGTIALDERAYRALTGDTRSNELQLWLAPGGDAAAVQRGLRALLPDPGMIEFITATELRRVSLRIFDRSFAVTTYLQMVAVAIGLVGVAASLSAQVLARRKEFGLLSHLGFTRRQVLGLVAGESAVWMAAGALVGVALGLLVSVVLVHVVNPQSFYWSMQMVLPGLHLALLAGAVLAAGVLTSLIAARGAAGRPAVMAVREDW